MIDRNRFVFPGRALTLMFCMVSAASLISSWYSVLIAQAHTGGTDPAANASYTQTTMPPGGTDPAAKAGYTQKPAPTCTAAIEKVMPSVVCIYTRKNKPVGGNPASEGGSGVILRADGFILTNRHVVEDAEKVWVTLSDMSTCEAVSIFPDTLMDLAVVKINAVNLPAATVGDSDKLRIGDPVIVVGNPLGLSPADGISSATAGIVSKRNCSFVMQGVPYYDMIQTDAAISSGNSGGPLINLDGEVIGINSAHALFAQNVGFAISMNTATRVFDDLASLGKSTHPYMGIAVQDMTPQLIGTTTGKQRRAIITNIEAGAPAATAGLKVNDIILRINDMEVNTMSDLVKTVWRMSAGDAIHITVLRQGETLSFNIKLATRPDDKPLSEL